MKVVFSIGGSILAPDEIDSSYLSKLSSFLVESGKKHSIALVVGGGAPARKKIRELRDAGASEAECDHAGILATRENARALIRALPGKSNKKVPESIVDAVKLFGEKILVMGGTEPGHSTDAVAALLAEWVRADLLVNATNTKAVYDKNPRKCKDAVPLKKIGVGELASLLEGEGVKAGEYPLMDSLALKIINRSRIRTVILDGRDFGNMRDAVEGKEFTGTLIEA